MQATHHTAGLLASRLREVFLDGKWIANTNYSEQIALVSWQESIQKTANLNTVAALIFHIDYYLVGLMHAFDTGKLEISDQYSFNCPAIDSEEDWKRMVDAFLNHAKQFSDRIEKMHDEIFGEPFLDEKYGTYLRNIEGVIEHSYYHLGQIVLIRKLIS